MRTRFLYIYLSMSLHERINYRANIVTLGLNRYTACSCDLLAIGRVPLLFKSSPYFGVSCKI